MKPYLNLLFAAIFLLKMAYAIRCPFTDKIEVHVINRLPNPNLLLHCASGDTELGFHNTTTNYDFNWSFCERTDGRTLFFCHLWWGPRQVAYDVFTRKIKKKCDRQCLWEARSDGIYFSQGN